MRSVINSGDFVSPSDPIYLLQVNVDPVKRLTNKGSPSSPWPILASDQEFGFANDQSLLSTDTHWSFSTPDYEYLFVAGYLWKAGESILSGIANWESMEFALYNKDYSETAFWINARDNWLGKTVELSLWLPTGGEKFNLFLGELVEASSIDQWIILLASRVGISSSVSPRKRIDNNSFQQLAVPGNTVEWQGELFDLVSED